MADPRHEKGLRGAMAALPDDVTETRARETQYAETESKTG